MVGKFLLGVVSGVLVVTGGLVVGSVLFPTRPANDNPSATAVEEPIAAPDAAAADAGDAVTVQPQVTTEATEPEADAAATAPDEEAQTDVPAPAVEPAPVAEPQPAPQPEVEDSATAPEGPTGDATAQDEVAATAPADVTRPETGAEPSKPVETQPDAAASAPDPVSSPTPEPEPVVEPAEVAATAEPAPESEAEVEADPGTPEPAIEPEAEIAAIAVAPETPAVAEPASEAEASAPDAAHSAEVEGTAVEAAPATEAPATSSALAEAPAAEPVEPPVEPAAPDAPVAEPAPAPATPTTETPAELPAEPSLEAATEPAAEAAPSTVEEPAPVPEITPEPEPTAPDSETAEAAPAETMPGTRPEALPGAKVLEPSPAETNEGSTFKPAPGLPRAGEGVIIGRGTDEAAAGLPADDAAPPTDDRPIVRYAAAFENPDAKPTFAIVLIDPGSTELDRAALAALPFPASFALDPQDPATPERAAIYRAAGKEVVMLVTGIAQGAQASDVEVAFQAMEQGLPQAVAAMDLPQPTFQNNRGLASAVVPILKAQGRGLLTWDEGLNAADQVARREDLEAAVVFRDLDPAGTDPVAVRRLLDRAVFKAGQEGRVAVVGTADPATVAALLEWTVEGKAATVALAPVTAVLKID